MGGISDITRLHPELIDKWVFISRFERNGAEFGNRIYSPHFRKIWNEKCEEYYSG